jgi:hypothetical protein
MAWKSPFIIYRLTPEGVPQVVFQGEELKSAKYWLTYIGETGDVLCRTPAHQKLADKKNPEYWQHKEGNGQPSSDHEKWKVYAQGKNFSGTFPDAEP